MNIRIHGSLNANSLLLFVAFPSLHEKETRLFPEFPIFKRRRAKIEM